MPGCIVCGHELGLREYTFAPDVSMIHSGPFCSRCKPGAMKAINGIVHELIEGSKPTDVIYPSSAKGR